MISISIISSTSLFAVHLFSVTSLFGLNDRLFVGTRSGHIVVINSNSLSIIYKFHGFCENVTSMLSLPKSLWNLLPAVSWHTLDADTAREEPSSLFPYLVSFGVGLQSYAREHVGMSITSLLHSPSCARD